jgi:hypothetical protein
MYFWINLQLKLTYQWVWIQIEALTNINYAILKLILIFMDNKFSFHKKIIILQISLKNIKWKCWYLKISSITNNLTKQNKIVINSWAITKCRERFMISQRTKNFKRKLNSLYTNILTKWQMRAFKIKIQKKIRKKLKLGRPCSLSWKKLFRMIW